MARGRSSKIKWHNIQIASRPEERRKVESALVRYLGGFPSDERLIFAVRLAVEEALTNAIRHGNQADPSKLVTVRFAINQNKVIVHVRDQGKGFNHRHLPDCTASDRLELPHGRGILLMCCYMDEVKFNSKGNCVTLMKRLPANPEPSC